MNRGLTLFRDRRDAGEALASLLEVFRGTDALVLAIPRGGVAVAHPIAKELGLELDILLVKKIGDPDNPEFAVGAVTLNNVHLDTRYDLPPEELKRSVAELRAQIRARELCYRGDRPAPRITGRTVIVVDDGVATGHTLLATLDLLRRSRPNGIVVALPVLPASFLHTLRDIVDDEVHLLAPDHLQSVGQYYQGFDAVEDEEVVRLLTDNWSHRPPRG
jgi:putative phosphoribosyl transferase